VSQNKHRCNYILPRWSFDSKPTLLCLQLYSEVTGNFVCCLLLSKLKLGLELKQKYSPKSQILNNSYPTFLGSCFNSQFLDWETICNAVGSVEAREVVIIRRASENCESKLPRGTSQILRGAYATIAIIVSPFGLLWNINPLNFLNPLNPLNHLNPLNLLNYLNH